MQLFYTATLHPGFYAPCTCVCDVCDPLSNSHQSHAVEHLPLCTPNVTTSPLCDSFCPPSVSSQAYSPSHTSLSRLVTLTPHPHTLSQGAAALKQYRCLIIDELHERSVESDLLLACLHALFAAGELPTLKLVLMSATANVERYQ